MGMYIGGGRDAYTSMSSICIKRRLFTFYFNRYLLLYPVFYISYFYRLSLLVHYYLVFVLGYRFKYSRNFGERIFLFLRVRRGNEVCMHYFQKNKQPGGKAVWGVVRKIWSQKSTILINSFIEIFS